MAPPLHPAREDSGQVITLRPIGPGGVDLFRDRTALDPGTLARCENVDLSRGTADRRPGAVKLARLVDATTAGKSRTFGATTKYATFTPPLIPLGGFAVGLHFVAAAPTNPTDHCYIVGARPSGQAYHVFRVYMDTAVPNGHAYDLITSWYDSGGNTRTVTSTITSTNDVIHYLCVYDPVAGTFTVYINGASNGTALTGLSATLQPVQDTGVVWTFGVEKQTGAAVTANTNFNGAIDGMTLWSLRGERAASGTTTLAETLRRHSARAWPTPQQRGFVLAHYDTDEASGTTMYDRSCYGNNGTYVGTPTVSDPVALLSAPGNFVGSIDVPAGRFNLCGQFGRLFYERTSSAVV